MLSKDEILGEIRRTAKDNGGQPLGINRFKSETGIGIWDINKYWPDYGDATVEAGFERNRPHARYPEGVLEEKMIIFIRNKLQRYPKQGEIRLEGNVNPDFPSRAYMRKGLSFVRDLVRYCEKRPDLEDVRQYCLPTLKKLDEREKDDMTSPSALTVGYVYLFKRNKHYKIGKSNDPDRRFREIDLVTPDAVEWIHEIKTDDPSGVENYWHKRFAKKKVKGEFYNLDRQDVSSFRRWKKIY